MLLDPPTGECSRNGNNGTTSHDDATKQPVAAQAVYNLPSFGTSKGAPRRAEGRIRDGGGRPEVARAQAVDVSNTISHPVRRYVGFRGIPCLGSSALAAAPTQGSRQKTGCAERRTRHQDASPGGRHMIPQHAEILLHSSGVHWVYHLPDGHMRGRGAKMGHQRLENTRPSSYDASRDTHDITSSHKQERYGAQAVVFISSPFHSSVS